MFNQRIRLESGLSIRMEPGGRLGVGLWAGSDPLTSEIWREIGFATNALALPAAITAAEAAAPRERAAMLGENRDVLAEARERLGGWRDVPPIVLSETPIGGYLAVSMRGLSFSAWLDGVRFPNLSFVDEAYRLHWHGDARPKSLDERFFPVEGEGYSLLATPRGLGSIALGGVVTFQGGEAWFYEQYRRREDDGRTEWRPILGGAQAGDVASWQEKGTFADRLAADIEPHYARRFDAFADFNVRAHERRVRSAHDRAQGAETQQARVTELHRERYAMQDLTHAEAVRAAGRLVERECTAEDEAFAYLPGRGGLRLVVDRGEERDL